MSIQRKTNEDISTQTLPRGICSKSNEVIKVKWIIAVLLLYCITSIIDRERQRFCIMFYCHEFRLSSGNYWLAVYYYRAI